MYQSQIYWARVSAAWFITEATSSSLSYKRRPAREYRTPPILQVEVLTRVAIIVKRPFTRFMYNEHDEWPVASPTYLCVAQGSCAKVG